MYKGSKYRKIHQHVTKHIHKHMGKYVLKHAHNAGSHAHNTHHAFMHIGELILVGFMGFLGLMFAGGSILPNNSSFSYPLQKVSKLECRTLYRNDMPDSCKINLPIIHGANYEAYENNSTYRSIYTALRAAPYSDSWNQKIGAHAGVDMATARGTPLYSIGDGEVYYAGRNSAYGNVVKIKYVYNGEIVYAVYAHMDTMDIKAGDRVTKGQRIGAVGNSGNTSGKLGGYHVHFEIDKDNYGRPAYSYINCPDLKKGHYKIIQNGLCRTELFTYQYDPIKIFESNSTYVAETEDKEDKIIIDEKEVVSADTGSNNLDIDDVDIIETEDNDTQTDLSDQDDDLDKWKELVEDNQNNDQKNDQEEKKDNHNTPQDEIEDTTKDTTKDITEGVDIIDDEEINKDVSVDTSVEIGLDKQEDKTLLELDFEGISLLAEHFSILWGIEMRSELKERNLMLGETVTLDIDVFKKGEQDNKEGNWFNGVLQVPFLFIASNDNIDIDINYLKLITKGKAQVEITAKELGDSNVIVEFGGKKIGMLEINIK